MAWVILIIAGLFEVGFTTCLSKAKLSQGNTALFWYGAFVLSLCASMYLLDRATKTIPMGTAYAIWTGIGAAGTTLVGVFLLNEPVNLWRVFFLSTLVISVLGLKMVSTH